MYRYRNPSLVPSLQYGNVGVDLVVSWYFSSCESHQDRKDGRKCFNCVSQKSTESKGTFELGTLPHIASY